MISKNIVRTCDVCQQYHKQQRRETYIPHEIPEIPWTKVGTDLLEIFTKSYLIVVDYASNFFDISEIPDKRSSTVVLHTKRIFSKYGIPKEVISGNGPEFIGNAYRKFSKKWDFKHTTSSPVHPQSNGQVERTIQTIWGEWPSGLRRCNKNRKVPGSKPTRCSAGLRDPTSLEAPGDLRVEYEQTQ